MKITLINVGSKERKSFYDVANIEIKSGVLKINFDRTMQEFSLGEWDVQSLTYGEEIVCCHCREKKWWNEEFGAIYRGEFLCPDCYNDFYGYCNECGELNKHSEMNDDIVCKGCEK